MRIQAQYMIFNTSCTISTNMRGLLTPNVQLLSLLECTKAPITSVISALCTEINQLIYSLFIHLPQQNQIPQYYLSTILNRFLQLVKALFVGVSSNRYEFHPLPLKE